jgi:glycosyltransferase involved in cell wall biosynthesis
MRIAFITHYTDLLGANRSLLDLVDGLKMYDVESYIVSPEEGDLTDVLYDRGMPVTIIPHLQWLSDPNTTANRLLRKIRSYVRWKRNAIKRLTKNLRVLPVLEDQLRQWNVDLIYTNSSVILIGALAAKCLRLPHVWHLRELSDLHYGFQPDWGRFIFRLVLNSADELITNSEAVRSHLLRGIAYQRSHVIYNGVAWQSDFDRLRKLAENEGDIERPYTFTLVGKIHPNKGQTEAIKALAIVAEIFPKTRLLIAGNGDKRINRLRQQACELGVRNNVEFLGYLYNPYEAYLAADATLMCSRYEAMGRVTAEAMAARRPVIGYDNAGTSEIIEHGHTGLLYRGGAENLAKNMIRFIENPEWAKELGKNGWNIAREHYSIENYSEKIYRILRQIKKS